MGRRLWDAKELRPEAAPPRNQTLRLAGAANAIEVVREFRESDGRVILNLERDGRHLDKETYRADYDQFSVTYAAGERYTPEIPLLKFPMHVGDTWKWTGTMSTHGNGPETPARATVSGETMRVPAEGGLVQGVRVTVKLEIGKVGDSIDRTLTFDFAPGLGVVGRAWGEESVRTSEAN